jgi:Rad52/22 family double-strand break repair protein
MAEISAEQYAYLLNPIRSNRIAHRSQGGKDLSYLESWDVRAHLIRIFGFGNFDLDMLDYHLVYQRDIEIGRDNPKPGWEVAYSARMSLTVRVDGEELCRYTEAAVGSASGSVDLGGLHDNALKTAASDAMKRCAINLGTQFGLSLYDNGSRNDVVRTTLVKPDGTERITPSEAAGADLSPEAQAALVHSLGAVPANDTPDTAPEATPPADGPQFERKIDTPSTAAAAVAAIAETAAAKKTAKR